ncbi:MAG: T9SS type A sorting domain-containing protein [Saprospiraceae bacterium]|nr:T9SS type A sorting domain-containing protein [Saprospiraceae bacterium]
MKSFLQTTLCLWGILGFCQFMTAQTTVTFDYTGAAQTWVVPAGVTSVEVVAKGAKGGDSNNSFYTNNAGGNGGTVTATLAVTPGTTLNIYVGQQGQAGSAAATFNGSTNFNGGGLVAGYIFDGTGDGGGGGATDIRIGGTALENRIIVAGGGGGGASGNLSSTGGAGGDIVAGDGSPNDNFGEYGGGYGGTSSAGGNGGTGNPASGSDGNAGTLGTGANNVGVFGGGGGGGYYGGGSGGDLGGQGGGGGGGSSYTDATYCTNVVHTQGDNAGHGVLTITYTAPILKVEWVDFTGKNTEGGNLLTWQTANEVNNKGFEVERRQSTDGSWETLGFVAAKGKSATYQFIDNQTSERFETSPTLVNYYRLRQIDNDGKETLSKVISITNKGNNKLKAYPSVTNHFLIIETNATEDIQVINLLGQQVINLPRSGKFETAPTLMDVSALPHGTYILKVGGEQVKFVKQ